MLSHCSKTDSKLFPRKTQTYESEFKIPFYLDAEKYGYSSMKVHFIKIRKKILKKDNCCNALYISVECWLCNIKIIKELGSEYGNKLGDRFDRFQDISVYIQNDHFEKHPNILEFYKKDEKIDIVNQANIFDYFMGIYVNCALCKKTIVRARSHLDLYNWNKFKDHFQECPHIIGEIARNAHKADQEKDNIISIIESKRRIPSTNIRDNQRYNHVYDYVFSWKKCDCGDAYYIICKICNNKFKSACISHYLYGRIICSHIKKKNKKYNYKDLIIYTTREIFQYKSEYPTWAANAKLGGYKCVICGMLYGSGVSEVPDEETVLAHFAACTAANSARLRSEGCICDIKDVLTLPNIP